MAPFSTEKLQYTHALHNLKLLQNKLNDPILRQEMITSDLVYILDPTLKNGKREPTRAEQIIHKKIQIDAYAKYLVLKKEYDDALLVYKQAERELNIAMSMYDHVQIWHKFDCLVIISRGNYKLKPF